MVVIFNKPVLIFSVEFGQSGALALWSQACGYIARSIYQQIALAMHTLACFVSIWL